MVCIPKQSGIKDCGGYALANSTDLCFGMNPIDIIFKQDLMRLHLVQCMDNGTCTPFPLVDEL